MKRILVTGGAGFIGSHTVDLLLSEGYEVLVYDNLVTGKKTNLPLTHPKLQFVENDIFNTDVFKGALQDIDAVLHLAALPSVPKSIEDPVSSLQANLAGFLQVLQAIRMNTRPVRLVYASSAAVYGATEQLPCQEDNAYEKVLSPYALEKANCERYADLFARLFNLSSLGLRYFNVYGSRQDPHSPYSGVISLFMNHYAHDEMISIWGDGQQARDFIHVSDVARANLLALKFSCQGVINIATGVPETLLNLIQYIEKTGKKSAQVEHKITRAGDIKLSYADIQKAEQLLGFKYAIPLKKGIEMMAAESK